MKKIEITVYNFNELNKEVQKKLIEKEQENLQLERIDLFLEEEMKEKAQELLSDTFKGVKVNDIFYSLTNCQGDGAMFTFETNIKKINEKYNIFNKKEIDNIGNDEIIVSNFGRYSHYKSYNINYNDITYYGDNEEEEKELNKKLEKMIEMLENDCEKMYKNLEKYGYNFIETPVPEEEIKEILQERLYYENGEIYKY